MQQYSKPISHLWPPSSKLLTKLILYELLKTAENIPPSLVPQHFYF